MLTILLPLPELALCGVMLRVFQAAASCLTQQQQTALCKSWCFVLPAHSINNNEDLGCVSLCKLGDKTG